MIKKLDDLFLYQQSLALATLISSIADRWGYFYQNTIGTQVVRSADSIAANIAEGYGRFHFKDTRAFCYYARGSLLETRAHVELALRRGLITKEENETLKEKMDLIHKLLNAYIKSVGPAKDPSIP